MSFKEEKRRQIKHYMLEKIATGDTDVVNKTVLVFQISKNTGYRYLRELQEEGVIAKEKSGWHLVQETKSFRFRRLEALQVGEDRIYEKYFASYVEKFAENVQHIWEYAFMEMMNNALDHSQAEYISLDLWQDVLHTSVRIVDDGVGIFRKIQDYYHFATLEDAIGELFKGKLTTDAQNHSGEGIFFTSHMMDRFLILSDGKIFTQDLFEKCIQDVEKTVGWTESRSSGTCVYMELSNFTDKTAKEIFDRFVDVEMGFTKTSIPLKNIFDGSLVSRSQAKRLCRRFENFAEVELDFSGVSAMGQGFAHEVFVVYQKKHPETSLLPIHMSENVQKMYRHVIHG